MDKRIIEMELRLGKVAFSPCVDMTMSGELFELMTELTLIIM